MEKVSSLEVEVLRHLVLRKLAGGEAMLKAVYEYLVLGIRGPSPSELEAKYGVSRKAIAAFTRGLIEKASGDRWLVKRVVARATKEILSSVETLITKEPMPMCLVCGRLLIDRWPEDHLSKNHREIVERFTETVFRRIKATQ